MKQRYRLELLQNKEVTWTPLEKESDGLMKQKFPNRKASILAQRLIVGVAILLKGDAKLK